jgi:hypothetical protein
MIFSCKALGDNGRHSEGTAKLKCLYARLHGPGLIHFQYAVGYKLPVTNYSVIDNGSNFFNNY